MLLYFKKTFFGKLEYQLAKNTLFAVTSAGVTVRNLQRLLPFSTGRMFAAIWSSTTSSSRNSGRKPAFRILKPIPAAGMPDGL